MSNTGAALVIGAFGVLGAVILRQSRCIDALVNSSGLLMDELRGEREGAIEFVAEIARLEAALESTPTHQAAP